MILDEHIQKLYYTDKKELRHIGVEIEYANLDLEKSAELLKQIFGGEISKNNKYEFFLKNTQYGKFKIELDANILQKLQNENFFDKLKGYIGDMSDNMDNFLDKASKNLIPNEIAAPPIPIKKFNSLDEIIDRFRVNGAQGTKQSVHYAFGVHFNVQIPSDSIEETVKIFKSFLILQKWIETQTEVDLTRKISPFINDFPKEYIKKVIDVNYTPTKEEFIEDYIKFNPTRNRILDMLPLFAYWNEKKVFEALPDEKINPRPTYHYRLPNSKVNQFTWSLSQEFQFWVLVEVLASNEAKLKTMSKMFEEELNKTVFNKKEWIHTCHLSVLELLSK